MSPKSKKKYHPNTNRVGQITVRKIGKVWAVCISGTPHELLNTFHKAEELADFIRTKHGRRTKGSPKRRKKKKK